jgi:hypothetical protein
MALPPRAGNRRSASLRCAQHHPGSPFHRRPYALKHRRVVAFESRAETSSGPCGQQPLGRTAGHHAAADVSAGVQGIQSDLGGLRFAKAT